MNRLPIFILALTMLPGSVPAYGSNAAANASQAQTTNPSPFTPLYIHYEKGVIDAHIDDAALGKVLQELALKTGMQINLTDSAIANWPVSASVKGIPLVEGIKIILDGFSYVLYPVANMPVVIVLSTQPDPARAEKTTTTGLQYASLPATPTIKDTDTALFAPTPNEGVPQSLDEFQPITMEEESLDPMAEGGQEVDPAMQSAKEQEHNEALLQRALDALKSEHKHLHWEATNQLEGMKDPRATQALIEATSSNAGKDSKARTQAVETLWRHAADLQFADETSVNALKQLAEDSDTRVAEVARQALRSMQQYQEQNAAQ